MERGPTPSPTEIAMHLDYVCNSRTFARSPQGEKLLTYLVTSALRDKGPGSFKGSVIGVEVFGLPPFHDPSRQSIVRVSVGALRDTLFRFYETEGRHQPIRIRLPRRSYTPSFEYELLAGLKTLDKESAGHIANARALMSRRVLFSFHEAARYLDMALARNPDHPRVLGLIAMVHAATARHGKHPRTAFETARAFVDRAKGQAGETWELPLVEAWITMNLDFEWSKAEQLFERAIQLNGLEAREHTWYSDFLASQLRWTEFLSLVEERANGSHYHCAYSRSRLALAQIVAGQKHAAAETLRLTLELFPNMHYTTHLHLGLLRESTGDYVGAAQAFARMAVSAKDTTIGLGLQALAIGLAGDKNTAHKLYEDLLSIRQSHQYFVPAAQLGYACIGTGDFGRALKWLQEGCLIECDPISSWIAIIPPSRHLRGEREFKNFVSDRLKLRFPEKPLSDASRG